MSRNSLPNKRRSETFTMEFAGERYHVTVGYYRDGFYGEVFINRVIGKASAKIGMQLDGVCRDGAILLSLCLQHGVSLETVGHAVTRDSDGAPATIVGAIVEVLMKEG